MLGIKVPQNLESPEACKLLVGVGESVGGSVGLGGQALRVASPRKSKMERSMAPRRHARSLWPLGPHCT